MRQVLKLVNCIMAVIVLYPFLLVLTLVFVNVTHSTLTEFIDREIFAKQGTPMKFYIDLLFTITALISSIYITSLFLIEIINMIINKSITYKYLLRMLLLVILPPWGCFISAGNLINKYVEKGL